MRDSANRMQKPGLTESLLTTDYGIRLKGQGLFGCGHACSLLDGKVVSREGRRGAAL